MEKRVPVKTLYLLLVIAIGLIVLGVGSTYAVFTASSEIDSPIVFNTNLSYTDSLIETVSVNVPSKEVVNSTIKITNSTSDTLNYVIWYINKELDIDFGISSGNSTGKINSGETSDVIVDIRNNTNSDVTVILGISSNVNSVVLGKDMTIIPNSTLPKLPLQGAALYISNLYLSANPVEKTQPNSGDKYYFASSVNLMNDGLGDEGNIRYYGKTPNNYIYFNCSDYSNQNSSTCELWRIIGVFDGKLKIVRDEVIGNYSWDYTSTGTYNHSWHDSTLNQMLNNGYYNNSNGVKYYNNSTSATTINFASTNMGIKNDVTRDLISESTWYLGGINGTGYYPKAMYETIEREAGKTPNAKSTWDGKIALMYPSDYGYASDLSVCDKNLANYNSSSNCYGTNWLRNSSVSQWLITSNVATTASNGGVGAKRINTGGHITNNYKYAYSDMAVRPTLYLNYDVDILDGEGTNAIPYKLKVETSNTDTPVEGVNIVEFITDLYNDNNPTLIDHRKVSSYDEYGVPNGYTTINTYNYSYLGSSGGLMNDNLGNIRYYGRSPNNFIDIGDRNADGDVILYRIVGLFNNVELEDGTKKDLVKVVSANGIDYEFNTTLNEFRSLQLDPGYLLKLMNPGYESESVGGSLWWNGAVGKCYKYDGTQVACDFSGSGLSSNVKNKIEKVKWKLSSIDNADIYAYDAYILENASNIEVFVGEVGLLYMSDYGFATDLSVCMDTFSQYFLYNCIAYTWFHEHVLMNSTSSGKRWFIDVIANVRYSDNLYGEVSDGVGVVYPTFYLKTNQEIISGSGLGTDPYVLGN